MHRLLRQCRRLTGAIAAGAGRYVRVCAGLVRRVWAAHVARIADDPIYAAALLVLLAGAMGVLPAEDVLAAVLAAVIEHYLTTRPGDTTHDWDDGALA